MKTKEELLKIYSAYLPYQLNICVMGEFVDEERKIPQIFEMVGLNTNYVEYHELGRTITEQIEFCDVFPHLWSMDMLTKEIEHKGERFIPIEKLEEIFSFPEDKCFLLRDVVNSLSDFFFTKDLTDIFRFKTVIEIHDKLLEWHFNVFGLDESEYIKKESVIQK